MEGDTNAILGWWVYPAWPFGLVVIYLAWWAIRAGMGIAFPPIGFFNRPPTVRNPSPTRVMPVGSAIAATGHYPRGRYNLPPGWSYDAARARYVHTSGIGVDSIAAYTDPRGVYLALSDALSAHQQTQAQHQALTQQFNQNRLLAGPSFPGGFFIAATSTSTYQVQHYTTTGSNPMWFSNASSVNSFYDDQPTTNTSELLRASEIVEQFESFMKDMGVNSPLKLPGEVFTRWLAYEAGVREDGDAMSPTTREILIGLENHPAVVEQIKAGE